MSYARRSENSDVYVIENSAGFFECYCGGTNTYTTEYRTDMITHMLDHIDTGRKVPTKVIRRLAIEIATEGNQLV